jgi:ketosteroid isomerase-like protein
MQSQDNLASVKAAYAAWRDTKGGSADTWRAMIDDDVCVLSVGGPDPGLEFAVTCRGREEVDRYFAQLAQGWDMQDWTDEVFLADGDHVAMFGRCTWTNRSTGRPVTTPIAHLWRFRDGKIVELREIFDSARVAAAAAP